LPAVENEDDALLAAELRQRDMLPIDILEREIRRRLTHLDPVEIRRCQVCSVFWP
jgi:hypothetical protein